VRGTSLYSATPTKWSSSSARLASAPETAPAPSCRNSKSRSGATTFSRTVISLNSRVIWNVRPIPWCARVHGAARPIGLPSNTISPASGVMTPEMRLKTVVLPEPLGPMSAVMEPSGTVKVAPSTARFAPNDLTRPRTSRSGLSGSTSRDTGAVVITASKSRRLPLSPTVPRVCSRSRSFSSEGRTPLGSSRMSAMSRPPRMTSRKLPPEKTVLAQSLIGMSRKAPSTGPHSEPRPPRMTASTMSRLCMIANIPMGST